MYQHILLPTDGSDRSRKAVEAGVGLARAVGAKVTGLSVIIESQVAQGLGKAMTSKDEHVQAAESYLQALAAEATRQGVPHETYHVRAISAYEAIIKTASAKGCDLICMASHGRRGVTGLLLGSETMHVLTHCQIPVLVYR